MEDAILCLYILLISTKNEVSGGATPSYYGIIRSSHIQESVSRRSTSS